MRRAFLALFLLFLVGIFFRSPSFAGCSSFKGIITNGAYGIADGNGRLLSSCNADTPFIPASIIKISTALAALRVLGSDYRFKTQFYTDSSQNLYIRGFGDPLLISEEVSLIIEHLKRLDVSTILNIYIDDSAFSLEHQPPGRETSSNPYDAPIGAASVNFNAIDIRVDKNGRVYSAEPQTPTLPIMKELGRSRSAGRYQINVCQGSCQPDEEMARFTAELFRAFQYKKGIKGKGGYGRKKVPADALLLYTHFNSRNLDDLVALMLKYSSNFIANLVYLTIGAEKYGYPATWDKATRAVHNTLVSELGSKTASLIIQEEGSGLSRNNRVTVRAMLTVLRRFSPYADLLVEKKQVSIKTGTMKGVYNYAGYLKDGKPFVILLNQRANTRGTVLEKLKRDRYPN